MFFLPVATIDTGAGDSCTFSIMGTECPKTPVAEKSEFALMILTGLTGMISFITIFLFRNRPLQVRLGRLALLLNVVLIFLIFFLSDRAETALGEKASLSYGFGTYLPVLNLVFLYLAIRGVRKDEELIRSADRIR